MKRKGLWALIATWLCVFCAAVFCACETEETPKNEPTQPVALTAITITGQPENNTVSLSAGTITLGIASTPKENVEQFSVKWESNNQAVASIAADGTVTLVSEGRTTITATVIDKETISDHFTLTVTDETVHVDVTDITITDRPVDDSVEVGCEPIQLGYEYAPDNADEFFVEWYSSTSSVATVDETGKVTVNGAGFTTIRVTVKGTDVKDEFVLSVGNEALDKVESVSIANRPDNDIVRAGASWALNQSYAPEDAAYFEAHWSSSDPTVAKISANGTITTLKEGTTEITLSVEDDETISDSFTLTVTPPLDPLYENFEGIMMNEGNFTVEPDYTQATLTLTSDSTKIPEGTEGSKALLVEKVVGEDVGEEGTYPGAVLTVKQELTVGLEYTFSVTVRNLNSTPTMIFVKLENNNASGYTADAGSLAAGATATITNTIKVSQSNPAILVFMHAVAGESVAFTVDDVTITEKMYVSINDKPESNILHYEDGSYQLTATTNADVTIEWDSSDKNVATVDKDGLMTLLDAGETTITAKITVDGKGYTDTFTFRVQKNGVNFVTYPKSLVLGESGEATISITGDVTGDIEVSADPEDAVELIRDETTLTIKALKRGSVTIMVSMGDYNNSFVLIVTDPYFEDFETAVVNNNSGSGSFTIRNDWNNASVSLTTDTDKIPAGGSGKALLVEKAGANKSYPGAVLKAGKDLTVGAEYTFSALVRNVSDCSTILMKLENKDGYVTTVDNLAVGASGTLTKTITVSEARPEILIFVIGADGKSHAFTVDNVSITGTSQVRIANKPANNTIDITTTAEHTLTYELVGGAKADSFSWASDNQEVATIDENGKITVIATGSTTITLTAGDYTDSFTLNVLEPPKGTLVFSEDFDNDFAVENYSGTSGNGLSFSTSSNSTYKFELTDDTNNLPTNGSGKALYWNPNDGDEYWASLNFNGLNLEAGKTYEFRFDAKLIAHTKDMGVIRFFIRYVDQEGKNHDVLNELGFDQAGDSITFVLKYTVPEECTSISTWISVEDTGTTQIAIDNFALYSFD